MYETILVPTDGGSTAEKGEAHAIELAASLGATIHALYVIEKGGNPWMSESMEDQQERARSYGQEILDDFADHAAESGVDVESGFKVGPDVYEEINEYVAEEGMDAIVMGTGYRGKFGGFLGSTAENVVRTADVPVTVIRSRSND
ncbi:MAG: universal stress protein [Haloarculaceae archaeon]